MAIRGSLIFEGGYVVCQNGTSYCIDLTDIQTDPSAPEQQRFFAQVKKGSLLYDEQLAGLSSAMNKLVSDAYRSRKTNDFFVGFMITDAGLLPVWKRSEPLPEDGAPKVSLEGKSGDEVAEILELE